MVEGQSPIRVFLVAPALVRWGLERLLSTAAPQIELSGVSRSLRDAAEEIESQFPDVVVVDGNDCSAEDIRVVYDRARVKILALSSGCGVQPESVAQTWVDTHQSPGSFVRAIFNAAGADRSHFALVIQPAERQHDAEEQSHWQQNGEVLQRRQPDQREHDAPRQRGLRRLAEYPRELVGQQDHEQHGGDRGEGHRSLAQQVAIKPCQHGSRLRMGNGRLRRLQAARPAIRSRLAAQV